LETTKPTRGAAGSPRWARSTGGARRWTTIRGPPLRRPRRTTSRKWTGEVRRLLGESTPGCSRLRQRGGCGPCDDETPVRRGQRGCACADGSRGSCADGGCWAGTCACSTYSLHSGDWADSQVPGRIARVERQLVVNWHRSPMKRPGEVGLSWTCGTGRRRFRPANGTRCVATGSIRPTAGAVAANRAP
jgi:hypothetical protein